MFHQIREAASIHLKCITLKHHDRAIAFNTNEHDIMNMTQIMCTRVTDTLTKKSGMTRNTNVHSQVVLSSSTSEIMALPSEEPRPSEERI